MGKINFTQEHFNKMQSLLLPMLLNNEVIYTKLNTPLNVVELLHTTTINSLNEIKIGLGRKIDKLENQDEWVSSTDTQNSIEKFKNQKEVVNLIIGYKRLLIELEENRKKRETLTAQIKDIEESQKTPEDKLAELKEELNNIEEPKF